MSEQTDPTSPPPFDAGQSPPLPPPNEPQPDDAEPKYDPDPPQKTERVEVQPARQPDPLAGITEMLRRQQGDMRNVLAQLSGQLMGQIFNSVFLAKLTAVNSSNGNLWGWKEETNETATIVDFTSGRLCNDATDDSAAIAINGGNCNVGDVVLMVEIMDVSHFRYQFITLPNGLIPLQLNFNSGSDGTVGGSALYTYDAYGILDLSHSTILKNKNGTNASAITPDFAAERPWGKTIKATVGIGYYNSATGSLHILWADEFASCAPCTVSTTSGSTQAFANSTVRAAATPGFVGQLGYQIDSTTLYAGTATTLGAWG